ncbi:ParB/RepB/Spo0J family partition protein [Janthinobacterium sp. CG3]|uniref:ParB/RepB/Spo0J family partition protein n=1 Tax=Janthinobacterium sp. CG3 TaxID=1075768 RepID=UPI0009DA8412|nr:ParB/RepB/Spo0J family partition protein [Janthinobacterium sp. CG3]
MSKPPVKVSGLIAAGKLSAAQGVQVSTAFDAPAEQTNSSAPAQPATRRVPLHLMDDSPYQPRRQYDPLHVDEIGQSLLTTGQRTPVTLRVSPTNPERFETLKGHYRRRGAASIGWTDLEALIVVRNEREAKLDTRIDNEGAKLNEYEYALMFRAELDEEDSAAKTQTVVANMYLCSQAKVSNCLSMLDLPEPVIALLNKNSALFGARAAKEITALWAKYPDNHATILEAIDRLNHGADQGSIKGWVLQKLTTSKAAKGPQKHVIPSSAGVPRYVTQTKKRDIIVRLADPTIDISSVQLKIDKMLRELEEAAAEEKNIN